MARAFSALPARALRGRPPGSGLASAWAILGLLMFGGILSLMLVYLPPGLLTDWQVRGTALALRDGVVSDSDCSGHDAIEICGMTVTAPVGSGMVRRTVHYMFLSAAEGPIDVQVVADPARPDWLTTDLGLDMFWNRLASLVAGTLAVGVMLAAGAWAAMRSHRRHRIWRQADALPVTLRLVARQRVRSAEIWTVRSEDGETARWPVPRKSAPFTLGSAGEILGLQQAGSSAIMPLDDKLRWVDLTAAERAVVLGPPGR